VKFWRNWATVVLPALLSLLVSVWIPVPGVRAQDEADAGAPVCPLSKDQTQKAIDAFKALAPVFRVDRCINCHGDVDPFTEGDGGHEGGQVPQIRNDDGSVDFDRTFAQCSAPGCHEELPGWRLAPEPISFVNKTDTQLCKQMRSQFARAQGQDSFMGHMKFDNNDTQFIKAAFKGNKAIKTAIVEKPTPWTQDKMVELSQAWVDAMGGRFHGDESCGCEQQNYALHLDYNVIMNINGLPLITGEYNANTMSQGSNGLEVPLEINTPNAFEGQGVMQLQGHGGYATPIGGCVGQSQQSFLIRATAQLEEGDELSQGKDNKLHVKLTCDQIHFTSNGACPHGAGSANSFSPCQANVAADIAPANEGGSQDTVFPTPFPNSQATLTTTVVKKQ